MKHIQGIVLITLFIFIGCTQKQKSTMQTINIANPDSLKIDSLTLLINENPKKAEYYAERSILHLNNGNLTKAIKDLVIANKIDSLKPEYYLHLSDFYLQLGKSEIVDEILRKGNRLIPNNKDILFKLGNLYFYIQDYKKATEYLNKSIEIDSYFAPAYFSKALVYNELGKTDKAIKALQIAVERNPNYYEAYIQLGLLFSAKNDSLALNYFDNALQISNVSYDALYGKAMFYQQNGQPEKAITIYKHILKVIDNNLPEIHFNLAYIEMFFYGEYMAAIQKFDTVLELNPKYVDALCNRGYCYEKLQNKSKARLDYLLALEIIPNYELALKGLTRLDKK